MHRRRNNMNRGDDTGHRVLINELTEMMEHNGQEGYHLMVDDDNIRRWEVGIFGPPGTIFQGGYFKLLLRFPRNYPFSAPKVSFATKMFHPNIYPTGEVCISILHEGSDPQSGEADSERWNPTQNVRTIILSIISMLAEPNISSPANVDASVLYRKWQLDPKREPAYANHVIELVKNTRLDASLDGVRVPITNDAYQCLPPPSDSPTAVVAQSNLEVGKEENNIGTLDDINDDDDFEYMDDDEGEIMSEDQASEASVEIILTEEMQMQLALQQTAEDAERVDPEQNDAAEDVPAETEHNDVEGVPTESEQEAGDATQSLNEQDAEERVTSEAGEIVHLNDMSI